MEMMSNASLSSEFINLWDSIIELTVLVSHHLIFIFTRAASLSAIHFALDSVVPPLSLINFNFFPILETYAREDDEDDHDDKSYLNLKTFALLPFVIAFRVSSFASFS